MTDPHASFRSPRQQVEALPLFWFGDGPPPVAMADIMAAMPDHDRVEAAFRYTPVEKGIAGSEDATKHLKDESPGWVLDALGDALMALRGGEFTSEMVRQRAEQSEAVKGWLGAKGRENCFPGWFRSRIKLHGLVRVPRAPAIALRGSRRGATLPWWAFPDAACPTEER